MKCFDYHSKQNKQCKKKSCRYWIDESKNKNSNKKLNCGIILSSTGEKLTLEEIGKLFNITRMRVCQIEKIAINKIKDKLSFLI